MSNHKLVINNEFPEDNNSDKLNMPKNNKNRNKSGWP